MLLIVVFLISVYGYIRYYSRYDDTFAIASFCGMLISYCCILGLWMKTKDKTVGQKLLNLLAVVPFFLILFGVFNLARQYKEDQLTNNGVRVVATVIGFKTSHTRRSVYHYAVFDYSCGQKRYLQKVSNEDDFYRLNDTLQLICSANDPEIFKILTVKHLYNKTVYHITYK